MKLPRRKFLHLAAGAASLPAVSRIARAQTWPTRPVTMIVPFAPGGGTDVMARLFASHLSDALKQSVIIENAGGAGGLTGATRVARSAPNGSLFLFGGIATLAFTQALYEKPPYNAAIDFEPVSLAAEMPRVLVVRKDFPASTLAEFIAYSKANHAHMQYASAGAGSGPHVCAELLNSAIGTRITHVPYRGGGPAMNDLIAGRVDFQCDQISTALPHMAAGTVKPIATLALTRAPVAANLATADEQGLKGFDCTIWQGFVFPKGTPPPVVERLAEAVNDAMESRSLRERLEGLGGIVISSERRGPEYFAKYIRTEIEKWTTVIKAANIKPD